MSAVNSTTFTNKKPNLIGSVAGVDPVTQIGYPNVDGGGGSADLSNPEQGYTLLSLTATKDINKGFLRRFTPFDRNNDGGTFRVREDDISGAIIGSQSYGAGNGTLSVTFTNIITNQSIGARTYVYTREQTGSPGDFTRLHAGANTLAYIVDIDDSTAVKNANIIRG